MNKTAWIIVGVVAIVVILFAGLLPLPGQKDNVTPSTQPGSSASVPPAPTGPPEKPATGADALKQQPVK
jgi:hypothetical protein